MKSVVKREIELWRSGCGYYQHDNDEALEEVIDGLLGKMRERCAKKASKEAHDEGAFWIEAKVREGCLNARLK